MRTVNRHGVVTAFAVALGLVACVARSRQPVPASGRNAGAVALPVEALVTLQDLMRNEVDASADPIWDSVGTISELGKGSEERQPRTDEQWAAVRQHAVVLLESTNLLVIPGRKVSAKPFAADGPGVFDSSQIQDRLANHRAEFNALALGLRPVAERILAAIDARDPVALLVAGEALDAACEACHRATWYPHEVVPPLPAEPPPPP